jgi:uncharacterized protein (DUF1499 family)
MAAPAKVPPTSPQLPFIDALCRLVYGRHVHDGIKFERTLQSIDDSRFVELEHFRLRETLMKWLSTLVLFALTACSSNQVTTGLVDNRFAACPNSPNCVSSDATDDAHRVQPYRLTVPPKKAWHGLQNVVAAQARVRLIEVTDSYLHIEVRSAVMQFIDDTEFNLRAGEGIIAVRSAARTGHSDSGVNRDRIERIRQALQARGLVE